MDKIIKWLLDGDPTIIFQTHRDLLYSSEDTLKKLEKNILIKGWGKKILSLQLENNHWGSKFYYPKWTSSHYTLLDLKNLSVPKTKGIENCLKDILKVNKMPDGGINPQGNYGSDVCINGMFLNYACFYQVDEDELMSVIDFIILNHMKDGGFNCRLNRSGAKHSSMHTTICTLEGLLSYKSMGYTYRLDDVNMMTLQAEEFLLQHHLYKSDKTGEIIHKNMLVMAYPSRWKYNVIRGLDYFRASDHPYDKRMLDALLYLKNKEKDGKWRVQAKHPGQQHFIMEKAGQPSRIITLQALRILNKYEPYI